MALQLTNAGGCFHRPDTQLQVHSARQQNEAAREESAHAHIQSVAFQLSLKEKELIVYIHECGGDRGGGMLACTDMLCVESTSREPSESPTASRFPEGEISMDRAAMEVGVSMTE